MGRGNEEGTTSESKKVVAASSSRRAKNSKSRINDRGKRGNRLELAEHPGIGEKEEEGRL